MGSFSLAGRGVGEVVPGGDAGEGGDGGVCEGVGVEFVGVGDWEEEGGEAAEGVEVGLGEGLDG